MNREHHHLGKLGRRTPEDERFRLFYGASSHTTMDAWIRLNRRDLVPVGGYFFHLLWALIFLKLYPKEGAMCALAGGPEGAIDPKTLRKWIWPFIDGLAELDVYVVSAFFIWVVVLLIHFRTVLTNHISTSDFI